MAEWNLNITKVNNGFVVTSEEENDENQFTLKREVFQEQENMDSERAELECMKEMLWYVKDFFGVDYSKHNKENLDIKIIKNNEEGEE